MIKLALTGNIASGKSLIEGFLQEKGVPVIDVDKIVHFLYENDEIMIKNIKKLFKNDDFLDENEQVSRKKIGQIVFYDKNKRQELEKIIHPKVKNEINKFFEQNRQKELAVVSIPLLFEVGWQDMFDKIIFVKINENIQLERLIKRNNLTKEEALSRINSQLPQKEKIKKADFIINNSYNIENTKQQLKEILNRIK